MSNLLVAFAELWALLLRSVVAQGAARVLGTPGTLGTGHGGGSDGLGGFPMTPAALHGVLAPDFAPLSPKSKKHLQLSTVPGGRGAPAQQEPPSYT